MTLASRLSASFLGALAAVLAGFSAALYFAAVVHFHRAADDRLGSALATLAALVEEEPGGLEWEPVGRRVTLGDDPGLDQVRWAVRDEAGRLLDQSRNSADGSMPEEAGRRRTDQLGHPWRVVRRELRPDRPGPEPAPGSPFHPRLRLAVGLRLDPSEGTLGLLAMALGLLATAVWGLAALVGRRLCRRALAPLIRMATAARELGADEPGHRLPVAATGDELEDLGLAFNDLLGRRHEALERQRRFAGDASHQLRTPLAAVLGQVDVALRRDRPPEEYRRVLATVRDQSDHLRRIVEALLFLARADADAGWPDPDEFDLVAWAAGQIQARGELGRGDLVRWTGPPDAPIPVRAHPALLAQVLDNLLDNARQHGEPGAPVDLRIAREPAGLVALTVEDRGRGIAAADLPRVFEPFFRTAEARRSSRHGVGLGLSMSLRIARAFGGSLDVESEPGRGARFTLRLPEARPSAGPVEPATATATAAAEAPTGPGTRPGLPTRSCPRQVGKVDR